MLTLIFLEIPFDSVGLFLNHGSNPGQISFHQWLTWVIPLNSSLLKLPSSPIFVHTLISLAYSFSALTLLVARQEGYPDWKT